VDEADAGGDVLFHSEDVAPFLIVAVRTAARTLPATVSAPYPESAAAHLSITFSKPYPQGGVKRHG